MTSLSNIIRTSDYLSDAVVVAGRRPRRFTPTHLGTGEEIIPPEDDVAVQRAALETAKHQAERIVAEAEAQAESIAAEARSQGYDAGLTEGLQTAEEQCKEYLLQIAEMAKNAAVDRDRMVRMAQRELSALALAIATRVIHREVATDPSVVLSMVESALQRIPVENQVRILVNPEDTELLQSKWSSLLGSLSLGCEVELLPDERVGKGGCLIETRGGMVDSRIETQMARIIESFETEE